MAKYYDKDFTDEISRTLRKNLEEYEKNWLLYHHETKFYNFLFENNISLQEMVAQLGNAILTMNKKIELLEKKVGRYEIGYGSP